MLQVKNISKSFQGENQQFSILDNLSFSVNKSEWISIIGPSGSGKSTLLQCIAGLSNTDSGHVFINQINLSDLSSNEKCNFRRKNIGFVFQDFKLLPYYSILDNVVLPLIHDFPKKVLYTRAKQLLEKVNIPSRLFNRLPANLSGGEKQRVAIARALMNEPSLLLCDEPTGNLDKDNRDNIIHLLTSLKNEGYSILIVTHDMEVASYSNRIYRLKNGVLIDWKEAVI